MKELKRDKSQKKKVGRKVALVTPDLLGLVKNGGVGTAMAAMADCLAQGGHSVTIFFCGRWAGSQLHREAWQKYYRRREINLEFLTVDEIPKDRFFFEEMSRLIFKKIKNRNFDIVHFPDYLGLGYYSFLAKKRGLGLNKTLLCTMFLGPTQWIHQGNSTAISTLEEVQIAILERKSIEWSDVIFFPTKSAYRWCLKSKWKIPKRKIIKFFPPPWSCLKKYEGSRTEFKEVVFFSRLEKRKGLDLFIEAICQIPVKFRKQLNITFLGIWEQDRSGASKQEIMAQSKKWNFNYNFHHNFNQEQALNYLRSTTPLVVIPSRSETLGFALLECLIADIPVLASDIEPFRELVDKKYHSDILFPLNSDKLSAFIQKALKIETPKTNTRKKFEKISRNWVNLHSRLKSTRIA